MAATSLLRAGLILTGDTPLIACSANSTHRSQAQRTLRLADPAPHGVIAVEMKPAFMRHAGVGQQRYVSQREGIAEQKPRRGELMLHPRQRRIAALDLVGVE